MIAPKPNKPRISKFGSSPAVAAKAMLHVQGQYKSNQPKIKYIINNKLQTVIDDIVQTNGSRESHKF